jgi:hypothetical protein
MTLLHPYSDFLFQYLSRADPADYHYAVETLKELLAFWLMVSRDAPDQGMGHSFVQDAIAVLKTAEAKYRVGQGDGTREDP